MINDVSTKNNSFDAFDKFEDASSKYFIHK